MSRPVTCWIGLLCLLSSASAEAVPPYVVAPGVYLEDELCDPHDPSLATAPDGFAATWSDGGSALSLERFDSHGATVESRTVHGSEDGGQPVIATAPDGSGFVAWFHVSTRELVARTFPASEDGELGPVIPVRTLPVTGREVELYAARLADGTYVVGSNQEEVAYRTNGLLVTDSIPLGQSAPTEAMTAVAQTVWFATIEDLPTSPPSARLAVGRRALTGTPEEVFQTIELGTVADVTLTHDGLGRVTVGWIANGRVHVQRFSAGGAELGSTLVLASELSGHRSVALTSDPEGNRLVTWLDLDAGQWRIFSRPVLADDTLPGPASLLLDADSADEVEHAVAVGGPGVATVAASVRVPSPVLPPPCFQIDGIVGVSRNLGDERYLLLRDGRFRVAVDWQDPHNGGDGTGHPVPGTEDAGSFWFFSPSNKEVEIKILDGRSINGHFWVFAAGLTDVGYQLAVTDQRTGESRTYTNAPFEFGTIIDTSAFPGP